MGVERLLIIRMARAHWVSMLSMTWGMRPEMFLETRSSGLKDVPVLIRGFPSHWRVLECTFVPGWLPQDLVASCHVLGNIICLPVLLDCAVMVLRVSSKAIQSRRLHGGLDCFDVDLEARIVSQYP